MTLFYSCIENMIRLWLWVTPDGDMSHGQRSRMGDRGFDISDKSNRLIGNTTIHHTDTRSIVATTVYIRYTAFNDTKQNTTLWKDITCPRGIRCFLILV